MSRFELLLHNNIMLYRGFLYEAIKQKVYNVWYRLLLRGLFDFYTHIHTQRVIEYPRKECHLHNLMIEIRALDLIVDIPLHLLNLENVQMY